jgi:two-component system NtrC family sensor kinase
MRFEGIKKVINNAHLFFIPASYREDDVVLRKCKVFINTTLITALFALFFLGNAILFHMPMAVIAMIICILLFFSLAWMLKFGVPYRACTNLYIGTGVVATTWDAYFAGGLNSVHTPWFVFPAIGAILVGTITQGRVWLIISVSIVLAFGIASMNGYQFPQELGPDYHDLMATSAFCGLIIILFIVVLVVENAYQDSMKKLESALDSLKKSQAQVIQQEKLASLGQMIAGIAHEIQNPLNFVNNFSSVSKELLEELKEAKTEEQKKQIFSTLEENLSRIEQHGKRADNIVKDMLLHSRVQASEKQLADINQLCVGAAHLVLENAKTNAPDLKIAFDQNYSPANSQIKVVPQEISRVILNLLDNAFYSVKQKQLSMSAENKSYSAAVSLTTEVSARAISITIKDNGTGISAQIIDKIFQPFFTTKPTKEGTGLGLSISYDIVKAHGGDIKVGSKEMEEAVFMVTLPL